eukprot:TRINITY_DN2581_c0_g1_i1.p1 TRINITY_DN2581_c0_g1~~TRINITY_DN2581_c0_g1_i1.p1  ORF type:complete len:1025 (+),score=74.22 TRINITY_DN2581_c0_g1_i1:1173-4247(+)
MPSEDTGVLVVFFLFFNLMIGCLFKQLNNAYKVCLYYISHSQIPYTSMLIIYGLLVGLLRNKLGSTLGLSVNIWSDINPVFFIKYFLIQETFLLLFIPPLVFDGAFNTNWHVFWKESWQIFLLVTVGVLVTAILIGVFFKYMLNYPEFTLLQAFMFGGLLAAIDPIAVISLLKELSAPRQLSTLIEGESILNDGTAMVCFQVFAAFARGKEMTAGRVVEEFTRLAIGGVLFGIAIGIVIAYWIERLYKNTVIIISVTLVAAYLTFFVAELTPVRVSGILAICGLGLYMTMRGKEKICPFIEKTVEDFWKFASFIAETLVFVLIGIIFAGTLIIEKDSQIMLRDMLKLFGFYIILHVVRLITIILLWPVLSLRGYSLNWRTIIILTHSGLRGGVAIALALVVYSYKDLSIYVRQLVLFHTAGLAFLTIVLNGTTAMPILKALKLAKPPEIKKKVMVQFLKGLTHLYTHKVEEHMIRGHFKRVNWSSLKEVTGVTKFEEEARKVEPEMQRHAMKYSSEMLMAEARYRFLATLKTTYWHTIEEYHASGQAVRILRESVDRAMDDSNYPLSQWKTVEQYLISNKTVRFLRCLDKIPLIGRISKWFLRGRLSLSYETGIVFILGYLKAEHLFANIFSDKELEEKIYQLSRQEIRKASFFIKSRISSNHPDIASSVQTRMIAMHILNRLSSHTEEFLKKGLMEQSEVNKVMKVIDDKIYQLGSYHSRSIKPNPKDELKNIHTLMEIIDTDKDLDQLMKATKVCIAYDGQKLYSPERTEKKVYAIATGKVVERVVQPPFEEEKYIEADKLFEEERGVGSLLGLYTMLTHSEKHITECVAKGFVIYLEIPWDALERIIRTTSKRSKLWKHVAGVVIRICLSQFPMFNEFTTKEVERLVAVCSCHVGDKEENLEARNGVIVLHGSVRKNTDVRTEESEEIHAGYLILPFNGFIRIYPGTVVLQLPSELRGAWSDSVSIGRIRELLSTTEPGPQMEKQHLRSASSKDPFQEVRIQMGPQREGGEQISFEEMCGV